MKFEIFWIFRWNALDFFQSERQITYHENFSYQKFPVYTPYIAISTSFVFPPKALLLLFSWEYTYLSKLHNHPMCALIVIVGMYNFWSTMCMTIGIDRAAIDINLCPRICMYNVKHISNKFNKDTINCQSYHIRSYVNSNLTNISFGGTLVKVKRCVYKLITVIPFHFTYRQGWFKDRWSVEDL